MGDLINFFKQFKTAKDCENFLIDMRFEDGLHCAKCDHKGKIYKLNTKSSYQIFKCSKCLKRFSVITGTIFEKSNIDLQKWFLAYYLLTNSKKGISSVQLSQELKVTQKTAWFMLHRLRELAEQDFDMFAGTVEVDETYIGGKEGNKHLDKKGKLKKEIVVGAINRETGKVKTCHVSDTTADTLIAYVYDNVEKGSTVYTDDNPSYNTLFAHYNHDTVRHSKKEWRKGDCYTNTIENYWSIVKRGIMGVYSKVSPKHLHRYLNEYEFRFNNRDNKDFSLIASLCVRKRISYRELTHG